MKKKSHQQKAKNKKRFSPCRTFDMLAKWGMSDEICEKGFRGPPLSDEQKRSNRKKSSIRSRV